VQLPSGPPGCRADGDHVDARPAGPFRDVVEVADHRHARAVAPPGGVHAATTVQPCSGARRVRATRSATDSAEPTARTPARPIPRRRGRVAHDAADPASGEDGDDRGRQHDQRDRLEPVVAQGDLGEREHEQRPRPRLHDAAVLEPARSDDDRGPAAPEREGRAEQDDQGHDDRRVPPSSGWAVPNHGSTATPREPTAATSARRWP
jgi:hypothetical protein